MKKIFFSVFVSIFYSFTNTILFGQESGIITDKHGYFKAKTVAKNVWQINGKSTENIYLILGKDSALVVDASYGYGDLKGLIESITGLPLIMVNTHGHFDHIGFDYLFPRIYIHPADKELLQNSYNPARRNFIIEGLKKDTSYTIDEIKALQNASLGTIVPVKEGYIFDLGGRKLEVLETPGHTAGSICLLDRGNRVLFTGDHCNAIVWLFLKECLPLEVYLKSLKKTQKLIDNYDIIMPGHNQPLDKTFMNEITEGVDNIIIGKCTPEPYKYGNFEATLCKYKSASIAYDKDKIKAER